MAFRTKIINTVDTVIQTRYIPMDTWYTNDPFIMSVIAEGMLVIVMLKYNKYP